MVFLNCEFKCYLKILFKKVVPVDVAHLNMVQTNQAKHLQDLFSVLRKKHCSSAGKFTQPG